MNFLKRISIKGFRLKIKPKKVDLGPSVVVIKREGRPAAIISKDIHEIFEKQKLNPTPFDSKMGRCVNQSCPYRYKEKFLSSLMDLETMSCFMKAHEIEIFSGRMTPEELKEWGDKTEYAAYSAGELRDL